MSTVLAKVDTPVWLQSSTRWQTAALFVCAPLFLALPWQQSVVGQGQVVAFQPNERAQRIEAPVKGRVATWHVVEGSAVEAGQLLVELSDIDPNYVERLNAKREAGTRSLEAARQQAEAYKSQRASLEEARTLAMQAAALKVDMAHQKVAAAREKVRAAEAQAKTAVLNLERVEALVKQGLRSNRDMELTILSEAKAQTELNQARAGLSEARAQAVALQAERVQKGAEFEAKIASVAASRQKAESEAAKAEKALAELQVAVSRQSAQQVRAPRAGVILDVMADQGGEVVKEGDPLALLIPNTDSRAVELWVDGNDAPLITAGREARVQFEGWPAVQFVGWPSAAVGTFPAKVAFVDAMGRKDGRFRVVVLPVADSEEHWPEPRFLRQGVKAKGWILLDEVSVGFELWRQFNGFPVSQRDKPQTEAQQGKKKS